MKGGVTNKGKTAHVREEGERGTRYGMPLAERIDGSGKNSYMGQV